MIKSYQETKILLLSFSLLRLGPGPKNKEFYQLLKEGAQPDFVMPWLPDNKRRR